MNALNYLKIQEALLNKVKDRSTGKLVDVLSETLSVSTDSAYRRIRNEKIITLDEVVKICEVFQISFDEILSEINHSRVSFTFDFNNHTFDIYQYFETVLDNLNTLKQGNGEMYYSAKDIPVFHFFQFKELTTFKVYYWLKTMSNNNKIDTKEFSFDMMPAKIHEYTKRIYNTYTQVKSTEVWNYETIHSTTAQIRYYVQLGYISEEQALLLLDQLKEVLNHILQQTTLGYKYPFGLNPQKTEQNKYNFFFNEILAADNSIFATYGAKMASFKPHMLLNYMITFNQEYCKYTKSIFENVIKKSTPISEVNEKDRNIFFKYNFKRIQLVRNKIEEEQDFII